jgi:hypothetical protein
VARAFAEPPPSLAERYRTIDLATLDRDAAFANRSVPRDDKQRLRFAECRRVAAAVEETLTAIHTQLSAIVETVLAQARAANPGYDHLSEKEQGQCFARMVGSYPFKEFLHRLRKGKLSLAELRSSFNTLGDVNSLAKQLLHTDFLALLDSNAIDVSAETPDDFDP